MDDLTNDKDEDKKNAFKDNIKFLPGALTPEENVL